MHKKADRKYRTWARTYESEGPGGMEGGVLRKASGEKAQCLDLLQNKGHLLTRRELPTAPAKSKGRPFPFCPPCSRGDRGGEQGRERTDPPQLLWGLQVRPGPSTEGGSRDTREPLDSSGLEFLVPENKTVVMTDRDQKQVACAQDAHRARKENPTCVPEGCSFHMLVT